MSDTIHITDGITTININSSSATGVSTEEFLPPPVVREGDRLVKSTATWIGHVRNTSVNAMDAQVGTIVRLLNQARLWSTRRVGRAVRLGYKRTGATNTAYWVITDFTFPEPASDGRQMSLESPTLLRLRLTLTVEPEAHAGAMTALVTSAVMTNGPLTNVEALAAPSGNLPAPIALTLTAGGGGVWPFTEPTRVWIARLASPPAVVDLNGTAGAGYYGGGYTQYTLGASETGIGGAVLTYPQQWPLRVIVSAGISSGSASQVVMQARLRGSGLESVGQTAWVPYDGPNSSTGLTDVGTLRLDNMQGETSGSSWSFSIGVYAKTLDGSAATLRVDYIEIMPVKGFVKLESTGVGLAALWSLVYEDVYNFGGFWTPRPSPQVYAVDDTGVRMTHWQRFGSLGRIEPGDIATDHIWAAVQLGHDIGGGMQDLTNEFDLTVTHLPMYALGLRGNA
jgi:hypothetical protein